MANTWDWLFGGGEGWADDDNLYGEIGGFSGGWLSHNDIRLFKRPIDLKQRKPGTKFEPGQWWWANHGGKPCPNWSNCTGNFVCIVCPDGTIWDTHQRGDNCSLPKERTHRCWVIHGRWPKVTINSSKGLTCNSASGSIITGRYHGFLDNGRFTYSGTWNRPNSKPNEITNPSPQNGHGGRIINHSGYSYKDKSPTRLPTAPPPVSGSYSLLRGDPVTLLEDLKHHDMIAGQVGTVIATVQGTNRYVVEFRDNHGKMLKMLTLDRKMLKLNLFNND